LEPHLAHLDFRPGRIFVGVAVNDDPEICLVDPVCRAADVVERRDRPSAPVLTLQLRGMRDKPDMHAMMLGKSLHLSEQLRYVLSLGHVGWAPMLNLVVGVDGQSAHTVAHYRGPSLPEDR